MRAAILKKPFELELEDYSLPTLVKNELRIQIEACGICGTDLHIYAGEASAKLPVIPGHEFVGTIVETGNETDVFRNGDRVAINPNIHCGACQYCRNGQVNLCQNLKALGVTRNGGFAEYTNVPVSQAYLIPADFPAKYAAFAEPLSCCLRGIQRAAIQFGDTVVILGGGTIGLLMLQLARLAGASKVILIEPLYEKRTLAKTLSANHVLDPMSDTIIEETQDITSGGADVIIECVGTEKAAELSLQFAKRGARIILFGLAEKNTSVKIDLQKFFLKEIAIMWSLLNPFTFQTALDLLVTNKVTVESLEPEPLHFEALISFFSQPIDKSKIKYQFIQNK